MYEKEEIISRYHLDSLLEIWTAVDTLKKEEGIGEILDKNI